MTEHQNIEYKQIWQDDILKSIVAFANSQGGVIYIGKDDKGKIKGLSNFQRLLEDLPNKIRDVLGIMVEVNLKEESGKYYIEIMIDPYSVPISYKGHYYVRSGSTKQELKGNILLEFLLKKAGKSWDDIIEPRASIDDIDFNTVNRFFRRGVKCGRMPEDLGLSSNDFLEKLRVIDNGSIKRAGLVLFGKDPAKFFPGMVVKIGRFSSSHDDLRFQEIVEGNLMHMLEEVASVLNLKFFTRTVSFEGLQRIEKGEYPVAALREMLLNSLVHREYSGGAVQIRMYDHSFSIWNEGTLPIGLSIDSLKRRHPSRPRNPLIADICFKGGYIDAWGRGTLSIFSSCLEAGLPEPEIQQQDGGVMVTLFKSNPIKVQLDRTDLNYRQYETLIHLKEKGIISSGEYANKFGVADRTARRDLAEMCAIGLIEKIGENKSLKYRLIVR